MPRLSKIGAAALAAFGWTSGSAVSASYLVVAGGGGGGSGESARAGGGGGAGGLLSGTTTLNPTLSYTVTVGAGGTGAVNITSNSNTNGSNSVFNAITSTGGGAGGTTGTNAGQNGGSGGGGCAGSAAGTGVSGQGFAGGVGQAAANSHGGGGGGASAVGTSGSSGVGGTGGAGTASSITGSSVTYAGGGGGGLEASGTQGAGGAGGGGTGNNGAGTNGTSGTANLGGGGGGAGKGTGGASITAGNGGSGVVIISYAGAQKFGGGVVTSVGGNTIHTFTTSGTLVPVTPLSASYLVVAGGGGGGQYTGAGGGGAGGFRTSSAVLDTNSIYTVTVGAGGAGGVSGSQSANGSDSAFSSTTSTGGGGGGGYTGSFYNGKNGGSGGGGNYSGAATNGTGNTPSTSPSQGNNGGAGGVGNDSGGGGGGATAAGTAGAAAGGNGGAGTASSISGSSVTYAGGGGGAKYPSGTAGTGGAGGGGNGGVNAAGTAGTANTGGGGGGSGSSSTAVAGGAGGSGIVVISYAGATQLMAGGTVTITGGNVIHTFTSSGYLTPLKYVNNSLRFRSSASAYLNRTPASASNQTTWTLSMWVKRGSLSGALGLFNAGATATTAGFVEIDFQSDSTLIFYSQLVGTNVFVTTQVFRDPAAWYHLVFAVDTTQATASNRVKLYVNGVQVTSFSSTSYPAQNSSTAVNSTGRHVIGSSNTSGGGLTSYFDGYMTEINLIDGQSLTPNSFGTFNSYGVWQPITYGGSYGTNGFYLPFKTNASSYVGSFNGSNQYLSIASNSVFNQSGDFTIEYYAYLNANTNYQVIVGRGTGFITIQHSSDANAMIRLVRYGQATIATGGNVTAGKWNHFAIVRSGSTVTGYLNGIAVVSGTDSTSTATGNALAIGQNSDGTNYFAGQISNVRYTNTAVYTSNFTPSTSALTAVSGTQLLTLQNSSIVDNSTNALSITNNNSVTTGQTYPFAYTIFNDQGPAGNNWTPNNVSGVFGSTLDYMTDVPTLTSATAANYCVLNPLDKTASLSVTNANLTASFSTTNQVCFSTFGVSSGKWYWEVNPSTTAEDMIGVANASATRSGYTGSDANGWSYYKTNGNKYNNATGTAYGATYSNTDIIGVALDMDAGTLTFYKNNVSQGTAFTGLTGTLFPTLSTAGTGAAQSINFGQRPFTYTPPTGFVALNTYNL